MAAADPTTAPPGRAGREIELKLRVDDISDLMRIAIASGGKPEPTAFQKNRYLDSEARDLDRIGVVLRLRRERVQGKKRYILTAKGPGTRTGSMTDVQEEEIEISDAQAQKVVTAGEALDLLESADARRHAFILGMKRALGDRKLTTIGVLKNERTRIAATLSSAKGAFQCTLELDRSTFPGNQIHHEVELEVPHTVAVDVAQAGFKDLFERAGVKGRESVGKARRFFMALRGEKLP